MLQSIEFQIRSHEAKLITIISQAEKKKLVYIFNVHEMVKNFLKLFTVAYTFLTSRIRP